MVRSERADRECYQNAPGAKSLALNSLARRAAGQAESAVATSGTVYLSALPTCLCGAGCIWAARTLSGPPQTTKARYKALLEPPGDWQPALRSFTSSMKIQTNNSIAVVLPPPIGDSLIGMVLVNNLVRNGYQPVVFGWVAEQLAEWFPWVRVGRADEYAGAFEVVIELRPTAQGSTLARSGKTLCLADLPAYHGPKHHMVDRIVDIAVTTFQLQDVTRSNGLILPPGVVRRAAANRVVIHPTGSHPEKMWSRPKFLALARSLERLGLKPSFLVAPNEFDAWRGISAHGHEVNALDLGDVARWIAESDWFIGNDSGLGHLASSIGVPTLTLFMRRGLARSWRPGWAPGEIVLPLNVVPSGKLKERLWKQLLTVRRVMSGFQVLRKSNPTALFR